MELRGFDHYEVTLGDEMRGERASLGKTLSEVSRDLRIRADLLEAVENCDASAFPNPSVVAGYVRSYARYLGMDGDRVFARFCDRSGFVPPTLAGLDATARHAPAPRHGGGRGIRHTAPSALDSSRFAGPARTRLTPTVPLGSIASALALLLLIGGLGYGGYALLENVQRVGFEPLPEAPDVVAEAPAIPLAMRADDTPAVTAADYDGDGPLAAAVTLAGLPQVAPRDAPISSIDPLSYGAFAPAAPAESPREPDDMAGVRPIPRSADDAIRLAEAGLIPRPGARAAAGSAAEGPLGPRPVFGPPGPVPSGALTVIAVDDSWIRIRGDAETVVFEGILAAGERFALPEPIDAAQLRVGNAGGVILMVGDRAFGPLGAPGQVISGIALDAETITTSLPSADPTLMAPASDAAQSAGRRAAAD